jgi:hypothetical protein
MGSSIAIVIRNSIVYICSLVKTIYGCYHPKGEMASNLLKLFNIYLGVDMRVKACRGYDHDKSPKYRLIAFTQHEHLPWYHKKCCPLHNQ